MSEAEVDADIIRENLREVLDNFPRFGGKSIFTMKFLIQSLHLFLAEDRKS